MNMYGWTGKFLGAHYVHYASLKWYPARPREQNNVVERLPGSFVNMETTLCGRSVKYEGKFIAMKRGAKIAIAVAAGLIAALVTVLIVLNVREGKRPSGPDVENSITYFYSSDEEITRFAFNDKLLDDYIAGAVDSYLTVDGSVALVRAGTGLYRVDEEGILRIYPAAVSRAVLSLDNNYILFCTVSRAFIYDHNTGKQTEIPDIEAENVLNLAISPSAKTFGVTAVDESGVAMSYIYRDGAIVSRNADSCIIAVSDDGEFAYYVEAIGRELTGKLYCVKNGSEHQIAEGATAYFELNNDLSEITFDIGNQTYYSVDGGAAKKLADASILTVGRGCCSNMGGDGCTVLLRDQSTIFNCIYYTTYLVEDANSEQKSAYDLYYVSGAYDAVLLAEGASQYSINAAGDSVLCVVDDGLYRVSSYAPEKPVQIANTVYTYCATRDFSEIYVLDQYACLNYVEGTRSTRIMANVAFTTMTDDGVCVFISDYEDGEGTLHWASKSETGEIAHGVHTVETFVGATMYFAVPDVQSSDGGSENASDNAGNNGENSGEDNNGENGDADTEAEYGVANGIFDVYVSSNSKDFSLLLKRVQLSRLS